MRSEQDETAEWLLAVRALAERLTDVQEAAELSEALEAEVRGRLGAAAVVLGTASEEARGFTPLVVQGVSEEARSWLARPEPDPAWRDVMEAVVSRRPVFWSSLAERDAENPAFAGRRAAARSWAILPLVVRGRLIGALAVGWPDERSFEAPTRTILSIVAHQFALALDRMRLEQVRRAERAALELLAEGTSVMVSALEPQRVIDSLVRLAVPRLAPWCAVYVAEGGTLRRVAVEIAGEGRLAADLRDERALSVDERQPLATAFRTGTTLVVPVEESMVRAVYRPEQVERILRRGIRWTALAVPIKASGRVLGVMSLVSAGWRRGPPDDVRFAAEGLAARAGVALANARRFEDERRTASLLMESIIPSELPEVPSYDLVARYLPAGSRVAGDWYDALQLPTGEFLIGIGDVGGHGIAAASLMSQLRNCARGFAVNGYSPTAILDALHAVTKDMGDCFATATYAVLDPAAHVVRWASSGHLPLLGIGDDGVGYLEHRPAPPLGCDGPSPGEQRRALPSPGSGLVLVTDGVVEHRCLGLDDGLDALRRVVEANVAAGADKLVEHIAEELCGKPEDDCCIVVLRRR